MTRSTRDRDVAFHVHGYTNLKALQDDGPLVITRGEGVRVFDEHGRSYIEGLAGLWCTALGFGNQRIVAACLTGIDQIHQPEKLLTKIGVGGAATQHSKAQIKHWVRLPSMSLSGTWMVMAMSTP